MAAVCVQAIAVGLLLGFLHQAAQRLGIQELLLPAFKYHGLKAVTGIDIADDLGHILQLGFD